MTLAQRQVHARQGGGIRGDHRARKEACAEHGEVTGSNGKVSGTYVETLANGEKVYYRYEGTAVMRDGVLQTMENKWQIVGGTAKLAGIKGQGTCGGPGRRMAAWPSNARATIRSRASGRADDPVSRTHAAVCGKRPDLLKEWCALHDSNVRPTDS